MKHNEPVILKNLSEDYPKAKKFIGNYLKSNSVPKVMISETLLVFEALIYKIFEQRENPDAVIKVSGYRKTGDFAIEISFEGGLFYADPQDPSDLTPEDRVLKAYADKIDFSYRSGRNRITITTRRNPLQSISLYAACIIAGIALYTLLRFTASEELQYIVPEKIVFPTEQFFLNAILMVAGPVTFLSMLKHLTDTYIISESRSSARRLHRITITSSIVSIVLAVISSSVFTSLLFADDEMKGKYAHRVIDLDPIELIPSLLPSDIFSPFMTYMPYSMILLAIMITYSLCSVGKYFDRIKDTIDVAYVLFAKMLEVVMFFLPLAAFLSTLDELFSDGYIMLLYLAEMIAVAFASLSILLLYYCLRLLIRGIHPLPYFKKMLPLLKENAMIGSAFDAIPYNIRYCAKAYGYDRKRLEQSMPVLAQINLDGNCFLITMIAMLYIAINSTPLSVGDTIAVGILVLLLSLGAPNQPGSCLIGLATVMVFLDALPLVTVAIVGEVFFGGILNLINITGDIVTLAEEEVREFNNADKLNDMLR